MVQASTQEFNTASQLFNTASQLFREMYKDERLVAAKRAAIRKGVPEVVVDYIVSRYHTSKMPTTDQLFRYIISSNIKARHKAINKGHSRATVGRWLAEFKRQMEQRGLIQKPVSRVKIPLLTLSPLTAIDNQPDPCHPPSCDTLNRELDENPDSD